MKVMLLKDVYKLGRAGDVKKVANGYGRNYLIPQGMAVLATSGALKQVGTVREQANLRRAQLNQEMSTVGDVLQGKFLTFPARAGETGKLYGSVTTRMITEAIKEKFDLDIDHRDVDSQPLRQLGHFEIPVRLTMDLVPILNVLVHREGEKPVFPGQAADADVEAAAEAAAAEAGSGEDEEAENSTAAMAASVEPAESEAA